MGFDKKNIFTLLLPKDGNVSGEHFSLAEPVF